MDARSVLAGFCTGVVGCTISIIFILAFEGIVSNKQVKSSHPIVIDNEVYRCVKEPSHDNQTK